MGIENLKLKIKEIPKRTYDKIRGLQLEGPS